MGYWSTNLARMRVGSLLSAIGGMLVTLVSVNAANTRPLFLSYPAGYPVELERNIGLNCTVLGIITITGAIFSLSKDYARSGGLVCLVSSGISAVLGEFLYFYPFYIARNLRGNVEALAPFFFLGVVLGMVGGAMIVMASKNTAKMTLTADSDKDEKTLLE